MELITHLPLFRSLPHSEFLSLIDSLGEPAYKAESMKGFLYKHGVISFDEISTLSKRSREKLGEEYDIRLPLVESRSVAEDGTVKVLLNWPGSGSHPQGVGSHPQGATAEAVLMPSVKSRTICISAQSGCRLACGFCATGTLGLNRNLSYGEILDQVLILGGEGLISRIVVMGMGEPMENLDELVPALKFMIDEKGLGFSRKKITVSTVGLCPEIDAFAQSGLGVELAISLHATEDRTRTKLIPVNKKYPIEMLMTSARNYADKANAKVTIEYTLLDGVNDTDEDAFRLARFSRRFSLPINLIVYNPVDTLPFHASKRLDEFSAILADKAVGMTVRRSKGLAINAACGQLAGNLR